jgi:predicted DNA-binding transcriptional regulator AlpA
MKNRVGEYLTPKITSETCSNIVMAQTIDIAGNDHNGGRPLEPLPMPGTRPVPCFFGRRFLTFADLIEIGFVSNAMTLRRLIAERRFPPPLALGRRLRLWDALELHEFVERLAAERSTLPTRNEKTAGREAARRAMSDR